MQYGTLSSNKYAFIAKKNKSKGNWTFYGKQGHVETKYFKKSTCNFYWKIGHVEANYFRILKAKNKVNASSDDDEPRSSHTCYVPF